LNYHSPDVIPYLVAIWGLILINIVFRSITTRYNVVTLQALPAADSTLITFPALTRGFEPGQHVRIRMWSLLTTRNSGMKWRDAIESHPFTISTASDAGIGVELVVKRAGNWTQAVYNLAMRDPSGLKVRCSIEGPYGMYAVLNPGVSH
jgi:ferric-chelate reductase